MFEIMPFDRRSYRMSYNPFRELEQMEKNFWGDQQVNPFRTDISETADGYKLEADLPGFRKEDIHIDIDDDILSIHAEHKDSKGEKGRQGRLHSPRALLRFLLQKFQRVRDRRRGHQGRL